MTTIGTALASPAGTTTNGFPAPTWVIVVILGVAVVGFAVVLLLRSRNRRK